MKDSVVNKDQPKGLAGDTPDADFTNQLIAEAIDYIHGKAKTEIVDLLTKTEDTSGTMGAMAFKITKGLLDKHKDAGMAMDIEMNVAMGLATEVIDMQLEILERVQTETPFDPQRLREDSLIKAITMYGEQFEDDPEAKEAASTMLRGMIQDGTTDKAFGYINKRASQEGANLQDMKRQGMGLLETNAPQKTPMAEGVQRGLMETGQ